MRPVLGGRPSLGGGGSAIGQLPPPHHPKSTSACLWCSAWLAEWVPLVGGAPSRRTSTSACSWCTQAGPGGREQVVPRSKQSMPGVVGHPPVPPPCGDAPWPLWRCALAPMGLAGAARRKPLEWRKPLEPRWIAQRRLAAIITLLSRVRTDMVAK
jgi:hypothetical protein